MSIRSLGELDVSLKHSNISEHKGNSRKIKYDRARDSRRTFWKA